ncbi:protein unc-13 homolog B-like [Amia ocellicauda]|uniref:protein unc-13 homolog B-like n=1 Tax=Amia ocellicauda TaxID=2972642 RepID=UPI0034640E86
MALLCVKVKRGKLHGPPDKFNTYVILKVQNLKSTTVTRRGNEPCWEQDYMFEINDLQKGLIVEVWDKRLIWDMLLGSVWIPLRSIGHAIEEGPGEWWALNTNVFTDGSEICGAENPTLHQILLEVFFESPAEIPEDEAHFLIQRFKTLSTDESTHQVSGEGVESSKNTDNHTDCIEDASRCAPHENHDCDVCSPHSAMSLQGAVQNRLITFHVGPLKLKSNDANGNSRKQGNVDLPVNHKNDVESCSTCSQTPSSQLSLESRHLLELTDSCSAGSRPCSSANLSQLTPEASYSEASECDATHELVADLDCVSQSTGYSPQPLSPSPLSDQEDSTCCSRSSSSCSCTSKNPAKIDRDAEVAYSNGVPREGKM